jgi:hypothetical protein
MSNVAHTRFTCEGAKSCPHFSGGVYLQDNKHEAHHKQRKVRVMGRGIIPTIRIPYPLHGVTKATAECIVHTVPNAMVHLSPNLSPPLRTVGRCGRWIRKQTP